MREKKGGEGENKENLYILWKLLSNDNFYQSTSFLVHYINTKYVVMIFKFPLFVIPLKTFHNDIQFLEITRGTTAEASLLF